MDTRKQFSKTGFKNNIMKECKDVFLDKSVCKSNKTIQPIQLNPITPLDI